MGYIGFQAKEFKAVPESTSGKYRPEKMVDLYGDVVSAVKTFQGSLDTFVGDFDNMNGYVSSSNWSEIAQMLRNKTDEIREILGEIVLATADHIDEVNSNVKADDEKTMQLIEQNKAKLESIKSSMEGFTNKRY